MQNPPPDPRKFSRLRWIQQITEIHCGPAVIQMLLENIGVNVSQQEITEAAGETQTIETYGTRVDQLAKTVHQLVSIANAKLWYKEKASLDDLQYVLEAGGISMRLRISRQGRRNSRRTNSSFLS